MSQRNEVDFCTATTGTRTHFDGQTACCNKRRAHAHAHNLTKQTDRPLANHTLPPSRRPQSILQPLAGGSHLTRLGRQPSDRAVLWTSARHTPQARQGLRSAFGAQRMMDMTAHDERKTPTAAIHHGKPTASVYSSFTDCAERRGHLSAFWGSPSPFRAQVWEDRPRQGSGVPCRVHGTPTFCNSK